MKKWIGFLIALLVVVTVLFSAVHFKDQSCEQEIQRLMNNVEIELESTGIENGGRCDGLCSQWKVYGCEISDDSSTWLVLPWGGVVKY